MFAKYIGASILTITIPLYVYESGYCFLFLYTVLPGRRPKTADRKSQIWAFSIKISTNWQKHSPIWGFADSWMTKAREKPTWIASLCKRWYTMITLRCQAKNEYKSWLVTPTRTPISMPSNKVVTLVIIQRRKSFLLTFHKNNASL